MIDDLLNTLLSANELSEIGSLTTYNYYFHGLTVSVISNSLAILEAIDGLLGYFRVDPVAETGELSFCLLHNPSSIMARHPEVRNNGELLFDSRYDSERKVGIDFQYYAWDHYQVADFGLLGSYLVDIPKGQMVGLFPDPLLIHPRILSNNIFITAFTEMLRARDLFLVHGGAVVRAGRGVLIPGYSGSGKTTLSLALVRRGFQFLADDRPVLKKEGAGFSLLAFPEAIDVTDKTISLIPELRDLPESFFNRGLRKKSFWVEDVYPETIVDRCQVEILLFPKISAGSESRLLPLTKIEAITRLLPHSLLVLNKKAADRQFDRLCQLVDTLSCYELEAGGDMLDVNHLLTEIV